MNRLNIDGTLEGGEPTPIYTQNDVNELARVFTGWDVPKNDWRASRDTFGDLIHPMVYFPDKHDSGDKTVLGHTISGGEGRDEILQVLDILMSNKNTAPFISKNLIMRLTKSNPSPEYVARVATVFKDSSGDLKKVVKAILLDPEIWEDINQKRAVKFKEPFVAYMNFLRAFNIQPLPYWYTEMPDENASNCEVIKNRYFFDSYSLKSELTQVPGMAPNVFNFYDNEFVPNNTNFKDNNLVAPEIEIQSDSHFIKFSNLLMANLERWDRSFIENRLWWYNDERHRFDSLEDYIEAAKTNHNMYYAPTYVIKWEKFLIDTTDELNVMDMAIDGNSDGIFTNITEEKKTAPEAVKVLIEHLNRKITGGRLNEQQFNAIYEPLKDVELYDDEPKERNFKALMNIIYPTIRAMVTSSAFMAE